MKFRMQIVGKQGQEEWKFVEAPDKNQAIEFAKQKGLTVTFICEETTKSKRAIGLKDGPNKISVSQNNTSNNANYDFLNILFISLISVLFLSFLLYVFLLNLFGSSTGAFYLTLFGSIFIAAFVFGIAVAMHQSSKISRIENEKNLRIKMRLAEDFLKNHIAGKEDILDIHGNTVTLLLYECIYKLYEKESNTDQKSKLGEKLINLVDSKSDEYWRKLKSSHVLQRRRQIVKELANQSPEVESPSIRQLAELRQEGLISEEEFKAFYSVLDKSTGQKAQDIIRAIEDLHRQYDSGAMSQGNYKSALWSLLDKLDRHTT